MPTGLSRAVFLQGLKKNWLLLGFIALAAVVAGVSVPQNLPGAQQPKPPAPAAAEKEKASAASPSLAYTPPSLPDVPSPRSMLLRLGLGTFLVLLLCVGTLWVGKRWLLQAAPAGGGSGNLLRVVETLALGNRCALHLVTAGGRQVLVGMDASGLKAVIPMTEPFEQALTGLAPEEADGVLNGEATHV